MSRNIPAPMPNTIRDDFYMRLGDRELSALDDNGRFIVRQMVADAYAQGFHEGRLDYQFANSVNLNAAPDPEPQK